MAVYLITAESGATYYSAGGAHIAESMKKTVEDFDSLPEEVQAGWIAHWEKQITDDKQVSGREGIKEITAFLKEQKQRTVASDAARKVLINEVFNVSLADAKKPVEGDADLLENVREICGVPYKTLASWADQANAEVLAELNKRAAETKPAPKKKA